MPFPFRACWQRQLGSLVRVLVVLVGLGLSLSQVGAAVISRPEPPWQLTVLPEAQLDRPVLRRFPFTTVPASAGRTFNLPVSTRLAGLSAPTQLTITFTNRTGGSGSGFVHQSSRELSFDQQGLVEFQEAVTVPLSLPGGWYEIWMSFGQGGARLDSIPTSGVAAISQGIFRVGEVLIEHPFVGKGTSIWSFNEPAGSVEFVDAFGLRWPLFLTAGLLPESGVSSAFGKALRFPANAPAPLSLIIPWQNTPAPPFTLGVWFNLQQGSAVTTVLGSGVYSRDGLRLGLVTRGSDRLAAAWTTQSGGTLELISTNKIRTNEWHHLALSYDGTLATLFVDGRRAAQQSGARVIPPSRPLMLQGGRVTNEVTFAGLVDELLVSSSALSDSEISGLVGNYLSSGAILNGPGSPPALLSIPDQRVQAGRMLSLRLPVYDGDYDLGQLSSDDLPSGAMLDSARRTFHWTPTFNQTGLHLVTIRAADLGRHTNESSFLIEVVPAEMPSSTNLFLYSVRSTNYPSLQPQLITITSANLDGLIKEGDRVVLEHATNPAARLRIVSLHGAEVYHGAFGLLPPLPTGHYFLETEGDRRHLVVLPRDYQGSSFLGTMGDRPESPEPLARSSILRAGWRRLGTGVSWINIEPTKGVYNWTALDQWLTVNRTNGSKILIMLVDDFPVWLRGATEATVIAELKRYVRDYVRRNKSKIDVLEPFNEPSLTPAKLASIPSLNNDYTLAGQFLARAYAEVALVVRAEAGTNVTLAGPTWEAIVMPFDRMTAIMGAAGLASSVGMGDFHDYVLGRRAPDGQDSGRLYNVPRSSEIMRQNTGGAPFFVSEIGLHGQSALGYQSDPAAVEFEPYGEAGIDWYLGFRRAVVSLIMYHGAGAASVLAHDFNISAPLESGGLEPAPAGKTRGFKPQATAHILTSYWLNQSTPVVQGSKLDRLFVYAVQRPAGKSLVFAWTPESKTMAVDPVKTAALLASGSVRIHDLFGREFIPSQLGEEPILFSSSVLTPTALAGAVLDLDPSSCDGIIDRPAEECDCNNLDNQTCASLGYGTGSLGCVSNLFDFSGCQFTHPQTLLTAHLPLDELSGVAIQDLSPRHAAAKLVTPTIAKSWVNSSRGRVLHFEGVVTNELLEYLVISNRNHEVLPVTGSPFTIALWVRQAARNPGKWTSIMGCDRYDVSGFRLCILSSGQIAWWTTQQRGDIDLIAPSVIPLNVWQHVAVTYSTSGAKLYIDGKVAAETLNHVYLAAETDIFVGHGRTETSIYPLKGEVDDIRIYSRVLSPLEIARLAAGP